MYITSSAAKLAVPLVPMRKQIAVTGFSDAFVRIELASKNIFVTTVAPGFDAH